MTIHESQFVSLRAFGYTEVESWFLYLVATHSGYFTVKQFLDFAGAKSGKRNARLVQKLFGAGHASAQRYRRRSMVYHLHSRPIYDAIGKPELRDRRGHELDYIKARLMALDYILAHPEEDYFETAEAKRQYFIRRFKVPESLFLPSKERGRGITFGDRFPLCVVRSDLAVPAEKRSYVLSARITQESKTHGRRNLVATVSGYEFRRQKSRKRHAHRTCPGISEGQRRMARSGSARTIRQNQRSPCPRSPCFVSLPGGALP
jgi:hypothetical protein